jgi:hypothetical protein
LQDAISYYDLLCESRHVNPDDHKETKVMYDVELGRLIKLYEAEEKKGNAPIPLARLIESLRPPRKG